MAQPLTTAEVAARCGVTPQTVRTWVKDGRIVPVIRLAGTGGLLFDPADVDKLTEADR